MRTEPDQIKMLTIGLAINQDEIRLDMPVAVIGPFTKKRMINVLAWERHVSREQIHNFRQESI